MGYYKPYDWCDGAVPRDLSSTPSSTHTEVFIAAFTASLHDAEHEGDDVKKMPTNSLVASLDKDTSIFMWQTGGVVK